MVYPTPRTVWINLCLKSLQELMKILDFEEINNHHHIAKTSENDDRTRKYLRKMISETKQLLENIVMTLEKAKKDQREIREAIDTY